MKLVKLTDVYCGDKIYINSNCILSCEHKYNNEFQLPYTKVGFLYKNEFKFFQVKENVWDIQSQIDGKPTEIYIDKKQVGQRIKDIRLDKGMNQKQFSEMINATVSTLSNWETGRNLPNKERLKSIAEFAGITVQYLLEG